MDRVRSGEHVAEARCRIGVRLHGVQALIQLAVVLVDGPFGKVNNVHDSPGGIGIGNDRRQRTTSTQEARHKSQKLHDGGGWLRQQSLQVRSGVEVERGLVDQGLSTHEPEGQTLEYVSRPRRA